MRAPSGSAARYVPEPGEVHNGWTVVRVVGRNRKGTLIVWARCECGTQGERVFSMIRRGESKSCGCRRKQRVVPGSYYLKSPVDNGHDGRRITRGAKPTPGGTLDADPDVAAYMRRHGVTRIEAVEMLDG